MEKTQPLSKEETNNQDENLKGTFISVLILGALLAISWLAVFIIFLVRNGG